MAKKAKPSKRWIGRVLTARQDMTVPVLAGSDNAVAEILDGQQVRVVKIHDGEWMVCRILNDVVFRREDGSKIHTKDLLVGVHFRHDLVKFLSRQGKLHERIEEEDGSTGSEALQMAAKRLAGEMSEEEISGLIRASQDRLRYYQDKVMGDLFVARARVKVKIAELALQIKQDETDVEIPSVADLNKQWGFERLGEARRPGIAKSVVSIARSWIQTRSAISALNIELSKLTAVGGEMKSHLIGVVRGLEEQNTRIDKILIALQRPRKDSHKKWYRIALEALESIRADIAAKARKFQEEVQEYSEWRKLEQNKLVQAFSWASNFAKRVRRWLGRLDRKITELEQKVFYG